MIACDQTVSQRFRPKPNYENSIRTRPVTEDYFSNCSSARSENLGLGLCDLPVSPGLKNRVRERLFTLVNQIDGYSQEHKAVFNTYEKGSHISCPTKICKPHLGLVASGNSLTSLKKSATCHCFVKDERNKEFQCDRLYGSLPMLTSSSLTRSRANLSIDNGSKHQIFSLYNKTRDPYDMKQRLINEEVNFSLDYDRPIIKNSEEKAVEIYPQLLEKTILIIDALKTRIEQLESSKTCGICRKLQNTASKPDDFIAKSDFMSGIDIKNHIPANTGINRNVQKSVAEDSHFQDVTVRGNGNDLQKTDEINILKKDNESLQIEVDYLKTALKAYKENDKKDMSDEILREFKEMYIRMLDIQTVHHDKFVSKLKDKLQLKEKELQQLKRSLSTLQLQNDFLKQFCKGKIEENFFYKSDGKDIFKDESSCCNLEKKYQNLLKESQDYTYAQIFEYKKAVRYLKIEIRKLKSAIINGKENPAKKP